LVLNEVSRGNYEIPHDLVIRHLEVLEALDVGAQPCANCCNGSADYAQVRLSLRGNTIGTQSIERENLPAKGPDSSYYR
jgi:hypothetical protein